MTYPDLPPGTGPTLANLTNRCDLLDLMLQSHLRWMHQAKDPHIQEIHRILAKQWETTMEQYRVLIEALQTHR